MNWKSFGMQVAACAVATVVVVPLIGYAGVKLGILK